MDSVAPVSSWIWLMILPLGPITSPILSTGTLIVMIRGASADISSGPAISSFITSRMVWRASRAWVSAPASTSAGMPSSLVSSWSAVTKSRVPATLKSMSPNASSAPRMSVSATYSRLAVDLTGDEAHRDAGDGRPQRDAGLRAATASRRRPSPSTSSRWSPSPRRAGGSRRGTPRASAAPAAAPGARAHRGRPRGAWASPRDRSHRWRTAGRRTCACSGGASPGRACRAAAPS